MGNLRSALTISLACLALSATAWAQREGSASGGGGGTYYRLPESDDFVLLDQYLSDPAFRDTSPREPLPETPYLREFGIERLSASWGQLGAIEILKPWHTVSPRLAQFLYAVLRFKLRFFYTTRAIAPYRAYHVPEGVTLDRDRLAMVAFYDPLFGPVIDKKIWDDAGLLTHAMTYLHEALRPVWRVDHEALTEAELQQLTADLIGRQRAKDRDPLEKLAPENEFVDALGRAESFAALSGPGPKTASAYVNFADEVMYRIYAAKLRRAWPAIARLAREGEPELKQVLVELAPFCREVLASRAFHYTLEAALCLGRAAPTFGRFAAKVDDPELGSLLRGLGHLWGDASLLWDENGVFERMVNRDGAFRNIFYVSLLNTFAPDEAEAAKQLDLMSPWALRAWHNEPEKRVAAETARAELSTERFKEWLDRYAARYWSGERAQP